MVRLCVNTISQYKSIKKILNSFEDTRKKKPTASVFSFVNVYPLLLDSSQKDQTYVIINTVNVLVFITGIRVEQRFQATITTITVPL